MINPYDELTKRSMQTIYSRLPESEKRHYAAIEAMKLGRGGKEYISKVLGISRPTLDRGINELLHPAIIAQIPPGMQRRPGGGRKKKKKKLAN